MGRVCLFLIFLMLAGLPAWAAAPKATIDPSELAAGSRPLGLGRAYVGLADDAYAMFQNPAGLAGIKHWQLSSMYSRVIEDVDFHLLGTVHPLSREAVGVGYLRGAVEGSLFSIRDPVTGRIVPDPDADGAMGYKSEVFFLSYAVLPEKYYAHPALKNISLGANFKIFSQAITGLPTRDVAALGLDLDLGIQYRPNSWLTLGAAGYNILPFNFNGKLMWASGVSESIPASAKIGCAVKLIGKGGLREFVYRPQELLLGYDYEFTPSGRRPGLNHLGLEWRPFDNLSLRLGFDQDAVAIGGDTGVETNLAAGVGLNLHDFRFDYAFHTFGALSANDTHFFSITYGIELPKLKVYKPPKPEDYFKITDPGEKHVTFAPYVMLKGLALYTRNLEEVRVNKETANLYEGGSFMSVVKLPKYAFNDIKVEAINVTGRQVGYKDLKYVRLVGFKDVGKDHPLRWNLGALAALGYIKGYKDETFKPEGFLTRAELCALLMRIIASGEVAAPLFPVFDDMPVRHWASGYIAEAVKAKVVKGFPDGKFRPSQGVTRAQAIAVFVRFADMAKPEVLYEKPFPDVGIKHWAAKEIYLAKQAGFLDYLKGKKFEPNRKITRGEVVDIMSKIKLISQKIDGLLNY